MAVGPSGRNVPSVFLVKSLAPTVLVVIMRAAMKKAFPLLLLSLSACSVIPSLLGTAANVANQVAAGAGVTGGTDAGTPMTGTTTQSPGVQDATTASTSPLMGTKVITFDTTRKLEYADLWVDMGDPAGQRALVPYLMKPEEWRLVGCEMTSPTSKHYRFMRVSTQDGKSLPQVDIFKQSR